MKTAIYIEDGTVQLVLTPESKFEKDAMSTFQERELEAEIFSGTFYDCRGGWIRQNRYYQSTYSFGSKDENDKSIMIRIRTVADKQDNPATGTETTS